MHMLINSLVRLLQLDAQQDDEDDEDDVAPAEELAGDYEPFRGLPGRNAGVGGAPWGAPIDDNRCYDMRR